MLIAFLHRDRIGIVFEMEKKPKEGDEILTRDNKPVFVTGELDLFLIDNTVVVEEEAGTTTFQGENIPCFNFKTR